MQSFERRSHAVLGEGVLETKEGLKSVWPETSIKGGAIEHGTEGITDGLMRAFDGTILVGSISTSRTEGIRKLLSKEITYSWIMVEFTPLVQNDILVISSGGMTEEPSTKPIDGTALGNASSTV